MSARFQIKKWLCIMGERRNCRIIFPLFILFFFFFFFIFLLFFFFSLCLLITDSATTALVKRFGIAVEAGKVLFRKGEVSESGAAGAGETWCAKREGNHCSGCLFRCEKKRQRQTETARDRDRG